MSATSTPTPFPVIQHEVDLCVVGGGMSGWATAIAAARHGATVVLMHDRPVLGGNASSEHRVHICGADRHNGIPHRRETGLVEELRMLNLSRNPNSNFSVFDTLLYEMVRNEPGITLLLNTTCREATLESGRLASITGWQMTTQRIHAVRARWFSDCSGDAILAPLTGARTRTGREARAEYDESLAPEVADDKTMGHSVRYQTRRYDTEQTFTPPPWAYVYESCDELPYGAGSHVGKNLIGLGYWWIELGGDMDTIGDTEAIADELYKVAYGVWDHIKNRCPQCQQAAKNLNLEWINPLPAKRESRRYVGAHVLTQNDLADGGCFDDVVAYGGWTMDDHDWAGFNAVRSGRAATHFNQCPSPYGIPYRSLYTEDVENLFCGGRVMSATHMAMSSTRVMATGMVMGQAVGTAVGLLKAKGLKKPADALAHMGELQRRLQADDCYLPGIARSIPEATRVATLEATAGDPEPVRDGWDREIDDDPHAWIAGPDEAITYRWDTPRRVKAVDLAFDSAMHLDPQMSWSNHRVGRYESTLPASLAQRYVIEGLRDGAWTPLVTVRDNMQRHRRHAIDAEVEALRLRIQRFHGNVEEARLYRFLVE